MWSIQCNRIGVPEAKYFFGALHVYHLRMTTPNSVQSRTHESVRSGMGHKTQWVPLPAPDGQRRSAIGESGKWSPLMWRALGCYTHPENLKSGALNSACYSTV